MWYISSNTNNGYPYNTDFVGIITNKWTEGKYNNSLWRIDTTGNINYGYPYTYYMQDWLGDDEGGGSGSGDIIDTGGYISNNTTPRQGTHDTLTSTSHNFDISISNLNAIAAASCNVYCLTAGQFQAIKSLVTNYMGTIVNSTQLTVMTNISGTNIFNGFVMAKAYPFSIIPGEFSKLRLFGYEISLEDSPSVYPLASSTDMQFNFGSVTLGISEGWHIKNCLYQLYLPFVGVIGFSPANNDTLTLYANCDLLHGAITYILKNSSGENLAIASGNIGVNVPINLSQAIQQQNTRGNILGIAHNAYNNYMDTMGMLQKSIGGAFGGSMASGLAGVSGALTKPLRDTANQVFDLITPKQLNPMFDAIFSGDDNTIASLDMTPKIIVRKAQPYNMAHGYNTAYGFNKSRYVDNLASFTSGDFVKCVNYKCTNKGLTVDEKDEIERLMNNGVII